MLHCGCCTAAASGKQEVTLENKSLLIHDCINYHLRRLLIPRVCLLSSRGDEGLSEEGRKKEEEGDEHSTRHTRLVTCSILPSFLLPFAHKSSVTSLSLTLSRRLMHAIPIQDVRFACTHAREREREREGGMQRSRGMKVHDTFLPHTFDHRGTSSE